MKRIFRFALAATAWALGVGAHASNFQYYIAPLQGVTGISQSANAATGGASQAPAGPKYSGMIDAKYADLFFDAKAQAQLIEQFNADIVRSFPTSVIGPNQIVSAGRSGKYAYEPYEKAQCSPTFRIGYRDAFAVSIGISRLSVYINDYADSTQVLIPVTYTVRFIKLNGAALLFSKSETIYTSAEKSRAEFYVPGTREIAPAAVELLRQAMLQDARKVVSMLVDYTVKNFQPKQAQATLVGKDGPYFIFDRGSEAGFTSGSELYPQDDAGNEYGFVVKYATERLAVAVASNFSKEVTSATNRLREGTRLTFSFDRPGRDDAKQSVMAVQYVAQGDQPLPADQVLANALQSILVDDLGFSTPFNLIKQDPDFVRLKNQVRSEAFCESSMFTSMPGFSDNSTQRRDDPDFYLKVDHVNSPVFRAAGVGGTTTNDIFTTAVTLNLLDRAGVVSQSFLGSSHYELVRTAGKGLSVEQAREVNLKNAGLAASKMLVTGFAPRQRTIAISAVESGAMSLAAPMSPAAFAQARLVRPLKVSKLNKTVMLPLPRTGEDGTAIDAPAQATQKLAFRGQAPRTSDLFVIGGSGDHPLLQVCGPERKGRFMQNAALKNPSGADLLLPGLIGAPMKSHDFVDTTPAFVASASRALSEGFFQSEKFGLQGFDAAGCFLPIELQNLPKMECAEGKCNGTGSLASGVRIFNGANKIAESIEASSFEIKDIAEPQLSNFVGLKAFEHQLRSLKSHQSKIQ